MYRVTDDIYVGRFASRERLNELRELAVTDVLNVSDTPNQLVVADGPFRNITWISIEDRTRIPLADALRAISILHESVSRESGRVYVHCMAGWNRSPTIIWLYLIACGIGQDVAARMITAKAFDAVPGHNLLVDTALVSAVKSYGDLHLQPHPRESAITP